MGVENMKRHDSKFFIPNPFKNYLYEVPNAFKKFFFSLYTLPTRVDRYEAGYDDITSLKKIEELSQLSQLRLSPFCNNISEDFFIENIDSMSYSDFFITQPISELNKKIQLLEKLNYKNDTNKIDEKTFMNLFIYGIFYSDREEQLTFDDIEGISLEIVYDYSKDQEIELIVSDTKFKKDLNIKRILADGANYQTVSIKNIADYYFDGNNSTKIEDYLRVEIVLSPVMIFEYEFYQKISPKILSLQYDAIGGNWNS